MSTAISINRAGNFHVNELSGNAIQGLASKVQSLQKAECWNRNNVHDINCTLTDRTIVHIKGFLNVSEIGLLSQAVSLQAPWMVRWDLKKDQFLTCAGLSPLSSGEAFPSDGVWAEHLGSQVYMRSGPLVVSADTKELSGELAFVNQGVSLSLKCKGKNNQHVMCVYIDEILVVTINTQNQQLEFPNCEEGKLFRSLPKDFKQTLSTGVIFRALKKFEHGRSLYFIGFGKDCLGFLIDCQGSRQKVSCGKVQGEDVASECVSAELIKDSSSGTMRVTMGTRKGADSWGRRVSYSSDDQYLVAITDERRINGQESAVSKGDPIDIANPTKCFKTLLETFCRYAQQQGDTAQAASSSGWCSPRLKARLLVGGGLLSYASLFLAGWMGHSYMMGGDDDDLSPCDRNITEWNERFRHLLWFPNMEVNDTMHHHFHPVTGLYKAETSDKWGLPIFGYPFPGMSRVNSTVWFSWGYELYLKRHH